MSEVQAIIAIVVFIVLVAAMIGAAVREQRRHRAAMAALEAECERLQREIMRKLDEISAMIGMPPGTTGAQPSSTLAEWNEHIREIL